MTWRDVRGWLSDEEAGAIRALMRDKLVLELGSYVGKSALCMAETARHIVTVDRHDGIDGEPDTYQELKDNIANSGLGHRITAIRSPIESLNLTQLGQHEAAYIDSDHDAESVARDTRVALDAGVTLIAYHDGTYFSVHEGASKAGLALRPIAGSVCIWEAA